MSNLLRKTIQATPRFTSIIRSMSDKRPSTDSAGSIRAAGGGFAKMEIAHEEEYFYKQRQEQLHKLKLKQVDHAEFHEKAVKDHEEQIRKHKEAIVELSRKK